MPRTPGKQRKRSKVFLIVILILLAPVGWLAYRTFMNNVSGDFREGYVYIRTGSSFDDLLRQLEEQHVLSNMTSFRLLAQQAGLDKKVRPGKYRIGSYEGNYAIVRKLRNGQQEPVKLVINKFRTRDDLIAFVSQRLETDTAALRQLLHDRDFLQQYGLNEYTAISLVLPDTYEYWWNTDAEGLLKKLAAYYEKYWTDERKARAAALQLQPAEVVTLASIVEEETNKHDEKPAVASVYLNRLRKGMPLQADPTVKFAWNDFTIKRILNEHTQISSPYNTYRHTGLPPGPICTPSKRSIEAVLDPAKTDYLYFCAREDFSGYHVFAETYAQHLVNARRYHEALNARNIR